MIPHHDAKLARRVRGCLLPALLAACAPAMAEELPPFDAPAGDWSQEQAPYDPDAPLPEFNTSLPVFDDTANAPAPPPAASVPDYPPPAVDAYVDLSFTDSTYDSLGFSNGAGGYRFVAGWILESVKSDRWSVGPEVGYARLGETEKSVVTVDRNLTYAGYDTTTTDLSTLDASSLDFGARLAYSTRMLGLGGYLRGGAGFYHASTRDRTQLYSVANNPGTVGGEHDGQSSSQLANSVSETGLAPFAALGVTLTLGQVPVLYLEYGTRRLSGEQVNTGALGFLLNF